jgi:hypothetical protein
MSIDQRVACRRAPTLPHDLPRAGDWKRADYKGTPIHTISGQGWLVNVMMETGIADAELQEALAEELAAAEDESDPADYGVMVYVTLEPSRAPQDGVDLMMAVLEMLATTCGGVVLAN